MLQRAYPLLVTGIAAPFLLAATRRSTSPPLAASATVVSEASSFGGGLTFLLTVIVGVALIYAFYQINKWAVLRSADFEASIHGDLTSANATSQKLEEQITKLQSANQRHASNIQALTLEVTKLKELITTLEDSKPPTSTKILARIIDGG